MNEIRLPVPNQDIDNWGDSLNDFLRVAHNEDGTLKSDILNNLNGHGPWIDVRKFGVRTIAEMEPGETIEELSAKNDAAFVDAIAAAMGNISDPKNNVRRGHGIVWLPPGDILISKPIKIHSVHNFMMAGSPRSLLVTATKDLEAMLDLNGVAVSQFHNIRLSTYIDNDGLKKGSVIDVIRLYWDQATVKSSTTQNTFYNIQVLGTFVNGFNIGFGPLPAPLPSGFTTTPQVDNDLFVHCFIFGGWQPGIQDSNKYWQNGMIMGDGTHGNNLNHTIIHCEIARCRYSLTNSATNLQVFGGALDGCEVSYRHNSARTATLTGLRIETSGRLLQSTIAGFSSNVTLDSIMYSSNRIDIDGYWIDWKLPGCLRLNNVTLNNSQTTIQPKMRFTVPSKTQPGDGFSGKYLCVIMDGCTLPFECTEEECDPKQAITMEQFESTFEKAVDWDERVVDILVRACCFVGSGGVPKGVIAEAKF